MDPDHDGLAPRRAAQSQRLAPELALVAANPLELLALLLLAALHVLEVAGDPLVLTGPVHKLHAVFPERGDRVQRELVIRGDQRRRSRNHHRRDGFIRLQELFDLLSRHGD